MGTSGTSVFEIRREAGGGRGGKPGLHMFEGENGLYTYGSWFSKAGGIRVLAYGRGGGVGSCRKSNLNQMRDIHSRKIRKKKTALRGRNRSKKENKGGGKKETHKKGKPTQNEKKKNRKKLSVGQSITGRGRGAWLLARNTRWW